MPRQHVEGVDLVMEDEAQRHTARRARAGAVDARDGGALLQRDAPLRLEAQALIAPIGEPADIGKGDARIFRERAVGLDADGALLPRHARGDLRRDPGWRRSLVAWKGALAAA